MDMTGGPAFPSDDRPAHDRPLTGHGVIVRGDGHPGIQAGDVPDELPARAAGITRATTLLTGDRLIAHAGDRFPIDPVKGRTRAGSCPRA
jgi:hypothetical protein